MMSQNQINQFLNQNQIDIESTYHADKDTQIHNELKNNQMEKINVFTKLLEILYFSW